MIQLIVAITLFVFALFLLKKIYTLSLKIISFIFQASLFSFMLPALIPGITLSKTIRGSKITLFALIMTSLLISLGMITSISTNFDYLRQYQLVNEFYLLIPQRSSVDFFSEKFIALPVITLILLMFNSGSSSKKSDSFYVNIYVAFFSFLISVYFYDLPFSLPVSNTVNNLIESAYWLASIIFTIIAFSVAGKRATQRTKQIDLPVEKDTPIEKNTPVKIASLVEKNVSVETHIPTEKMTMDTPKENITTSTIQLELNKNQHISETNEIFNNSLNEQNIQKKEKFNLYLSHDSFYAYEKELNSRPSSLIKGMMNSIYTGKELTGSKASGANKVKNAIESYNDYEFNPILLIDTTGLGSGNEGICINTNCIRAKNSNGKYTFYYSDINRFHVDKQTQEIVINHERFHYTHSELTGRMEIISRVINKHLDEISKSA